MYVHWGTVYNSKDLEPTQMPINCRLDKEDVAHMHHETVCSHKKKWQEFVSFVETWVNLETIILSKLKQAEKTKHHMFSLIGGWRTMRTLGHREEDNTHCGRCRGVEGRDSRGWGVGERNARCGWRGGRQITLPRVYLCNYLACSAYVPPNLKCNKKNHVEIPFHTR